MRLIDLIVGSVSDKAVHFIGHVVLHEQLSHFLCCFGEKQNVITSQQEAEISQFVLLVYEYCLINKCLRLHFEKTHFRSDKADREGTSALFRPGKHLEM